jgi:hypothetical protein
VGGEPTGSAVFTSETDDFAAAGAVMEKLIADHEGASMMSITENGPLVSYQTSFWMGIPL